MSTSLAQNCFESNLELTDKYVTTLCVSQGARACWGSLLRSQQPPHRSRPFGTSITLAYTLRC